MGGFVWEEVWGGETTSQCWIGVLDENSEVDGKKIEKNLGEWEKSGCTFL